MELKQKARVSLTRWVTGKMLATLCAQRGRFSRGKKVPLKRNMGVTNKKIGRLNISMAVTVPVKNSPMDPKAMPPTKAKGMIRKPPGYWTRPKRLITPCMIAVAMTDLVAPQMISAVMISSRDSGVAIMASKVF